MVGTTMKRYLVQTALMLKPGSYLLALLHKPDGGDWTLSGSTLYPNPIQVIVRAPGETLDIYEPNDSESSAENLTVNFSGNNASVYTTGSNSHSGIDYDYITLIFHQDMIIL